MSDIALSWDKTRADVQLVGKGLRTGDDLITALTVSLFTDRRAADDDELLDGSDDRRGWWGDNAAAPLGSRLWMLERSKRTQQTLQLARDYIAEALQWLIDDGVVSAFDITVEWLPGSQLSALVTAHRNDGTREANSFTWAWNGIN